MPNPTTATTHPENNIWYDANCHCRLVQLRLRIPPFNPEDPATTEHTKAFNCNCSICTKNGYLNIYPEDNEKDIEWISGRDQLKEYRYGSKNVGHMFCPNCGSSVAVFVDHVSFKNGGRGEAINARMIKGVDIDKLDRIVFQGGKDLGFVYDP